MSGYRGIIRFVNTDALVARAVQDVKLTPPCWRGKGFAWAGAVAEFRIRLTMARLKRAA